MLPKKSYDLICGTKRVTATSAYVPRLSYVVRPFLSMVGRRLPAPFHWFLFHELLIQVLDRQARMLSSSS